MNFFQFVIRNKVASVSLKNEKSKHHPRCTGFGPNTHWALLLFCYFVNGNGMTMQL